MCKWRDEELGIDGQAILELIHRWEWTKAGWIVYYKRNNSVIKRINALEMYYGAT
jgi:hypothetical protein